LFIASRVPLKTNTPDSLPAGIKQVNGLRTKWVNSGGAKTRIVLNKKEASKVANKWKFNTLETVEKQEIRAGGSQLPGQKSP
jgi:hypothetical protein